jgi:6-methylsalicylate decarboxylase
MTFPRIDVHAHFLPDFYSDALRAAGQRRPDGMPAIPEWTEESALRMMDGLGIAASVISISSPGVYFGDKAAAHNLAMRTNEEAARLQRDHSARFGWFAATSLPNVEAAIAEACEALDEKGADGVVVETNQDGMYLGNPKLEPFYKALDERGAVMFVHPTSPKCQGCSSLTLGYPEPMLEFMFETTRTITNMLLSGVTLRYPNIRVIVPHAGAALSVLASRVDLQMPFFEANSAHKSPNLHGELKKLYYDLAGAPLPELLSVLLQIADPHHIMYGSDWPYTALALCTDVTGKLDRTPLLAGDLREDVMYRNARTLFPKLIEAIQS